MSALRISRPGYPTELVLSYPATPRVKGVGGASLGYFSATTLLPVAKSNSEHRREQMREASARYRARLAAK